MDLKVDKASHTQRSKVIMGGSQLGSVSGLGSSSGSLQYVVKSCSDCQTTRTPLWRGGPAGPKSLCNACGIKYNKKRRELLGLDKTRIDKSKKKKKTGGGSGSGDTKSKEGPGGGGGGGGLGQSLKMKLMALGGEMMLNESSWKLLGSLREEEQAAILLMALSCGSIYA